MMTSISCLLGASIIALLISRRTPTTWLELKNITWGKVCLLLILIESWFTVVGAGFILTGIGVNGNPVTCNFISIACLIFVGGTKFLIYAFLVEKVYIVWSGGFRTPRLKTAVYRICLVFQLAYLGVAVLYLIERSTVILEDGACLLGFKDVASKVMSPALRVVAKKTLIGSVLGWAIIATNSLVIIGMKGKELDWVCITSCVFDVTLNALVLYWVSSGAPSDSVNHFTLPTISLAASTSTTMSGFAEDQPENKNEEGGQTSPAGVLEFNPIHSLQTHNIDLEQHGSRGKLSAPDLR
ncbi:hypothetical protein V5O48_012060 [Marasmius crinis-equi]|uniref:Uncharacterized protein n=1 Tax=Marasmius crinis-equi TaxID=585013 RepID=A0ABR3F3U5_9AGAR